MKLTRKCKSDRIELLEFERSVISSLCLVFWPTVEPWTWMPSKQSKSSFGNALKLDSYSLDSDLAFKQLDFTTSLRHYVRSIISPKSAAFRSLNPDTFTNLNIQSNPSSLPNLNRLSQPDPGIRSQPPSESLTDFRSNTRSRRVNAIRGGAGNLRCSRI
jgi:hypothetical protein